MKDNDAAQENADGLVPSNTVRIESLDEEINDVVARKRFIFFFVISLHLNYFVL